MFQFHCCGVNGWSDWTNSSSPTKGKIPVSCCGPIAGSMEVFKCENETKTLYKTGCVEAFGDFAEEHASSIGLVGVLLAFVQVSPFVFYLKVTSTK